MLAECDGEPLSGQAICEKLDLPRRVLLETVDSLRMRGFVINAGPGWGYLPFAPPTPNMRVSCVASQSSVRTFQIVEVLTYN